jgi:hypothetical protein
VIEMTRFLIVLGLVILVAGLLWPYLSRIGLGRLPGDIVIERGNVTFYFPLMTCLLVSLVFSLVFWVVNR